MRPQAYNGPSDGRHRMIRRRTFFQTVGLALPLAAAPQASGTPREYWVRQLSRLAEPVLTNLAAGTLKRNMPVEVAGKNGEERRKFSHLEAFGRLLAGIAPWLQARLPAGAERDLQQRYASLARAAIRQATDPKSPDFLNFRDGQQPLVDAAFLAHGVLRAPDQLWKELDASTRNNLAAALRATRAITPGFNNWLLFSAMVETALAFMGEEWDAMRVDYALRSHQQWYAGDGMYGDGPSFHWDYYNSFVIQPMFLDVLSLAGSRRWDAMRPDVEKRAQRYAAIQERLIAPDGSYPPIGRSITYRCGAFQLLAQMALRKQLPAPLTGAQVREALTAMMQRVLGAPGTFDADGWLTIGLCGHQPHLGESYISTGSLYLCSTVMLPLGLPPSDEFWSAAAQDWTSKKLWNGRDELADHAL